ncbi:MAG TPA: GNAT family N-acetyltransferase [Kiritimatiellia bacterium]|nr:GNAT family N-acetyltransferase [Kiritimatiellia bacterium]HRZ12696.1 GNAT family N-acetyltransferase [Kiritimatiellia bacterium]HSA19536.1 GNAT family N-acetyltransferase [Kiritimatiellia bacterium]
MKLEAASGRAPPGLLELLRDLGDGENGFMGTPVPSGEMGLEEYLQRCVEGPDPARLRPGLAPQTVFWMIDDDGVAVGMVRMRHSLNDRLRAHGGHIGFYVRRDRRGRGHARAALRMALAELAKRGERKALLTVATDNAPSLRVVEACGGRCDGESVDPESGRRLRRYWIDLPPPAGRPE